MTIDGTEKEGVCECCGITYSKTKYFKDENPYFCKWYSVQCPECGFHPDLEDDIRKIIKNNLIMSISDNGTSVNGTEVSYKISDYIKKLLIRKER